MNEKKTTVATASPLVLLDNSDKNRIEMELLLDDEGACTKEQEVHKNSILELRDTYGFHLHAVAAVTENISRRAKKEEQYGAGADNGGDHDASSSSSSNFSWKAWIMATGSLSLTIIQILILHWMISEVTFPRCSMHSDCNRGEYCDYWEMTKDLNAPRCLDCNYIYPGQNETVRELCKANYEYYKNIRDDVTVWVSADNIWHPTSLMNITAVLCLEYMHCQQTSIGDDQLVIEAELGKWPYEGTWPYGDGINMDNPGCDYSKLNTIKLTWTNVVALLFITLLFAVSIRSDITESISEETLLEFKLNTVSQEVFPRPTSSRPIDVLRFALRMRKFILPWAISLAAASIIITEPLTTTNILLNLVAIGFITEADNILVKFTLTVDEKKRIQRFLNDAEQNMVNRSDMRHFLWPWALVAGPLIMMVFTILRTENVILFFYPSEADCSGFWVLAFMFTVYLPLGLVGIENIVAFVKSDRTANRFVLSTQDLCRTLNVILISRLLVEFAHLFIYLDGEHVFWFGFACIVFLINFLFNIGFDHLLYCIKTGNQSDTPNCKDNIENGPGDIGLIGDVLGGDDDEGNNELQDFGSPTNPMVGAGGVNFVSAPNNYCLLAYSIFYWCCLLSYATFEVLDWRTYEPLNDTIDNLREKLGLVGDWEM